MKPEMDYYKTLGLNKSVGSDEIKKAYRKLAKTCHPDLNPNDKNAEERFKELSEAYQVLSDPEQRKLYDAGGFDPHTGARQQSQGPFYRNTQDSDSRYQDIFRDAFSGYDFEDLFGGSAQQRNSIPRSGQNHLFVMDVDFSDCVLGREKTFETPDGKKISVKIPPGIKTGQRLRFKGQGGPGQNGGPAGDLYLQIRVRPSGEFKRIGNDLEIEIPVLFSLAMLGGKTSVPTVDGKVELEIPKNVSSGTKLRIKGKGIRIKDGPGDLFVRLKIVIPKVVSPELESAVKHWHESQEGGLR